MNYLLITISVLYFIYIRQTLSLGSNGAIEDNDLGQATRYCSANYCNSKDSLELWLAIEFQCIGQFIDEPLTPSYASRTASSSNVIRVETATDTEAKGSSSISRHSIGIICSIIALAGLWIGYYVGRLVSGKARWPIRYSPVSTSDDMHATSEKEVLFSQNFT
jgi:hypothetical protein